MNKTNEEYNLSFTIEFNHLLEAGLTINQYFFLQLSDQSAREAYRLYLEQFPQPITRLDIEYLIEKGLLKTKEGSKYTFENLTTTKLYRDLFEKKVPDAIKELEETYPKKTPIKKRRLQSDGHKWKPKYLSIIKGKPELHEKILMCIKAEAAHRRKVGNEEFWPLLMTYINNQRWEDYEDEIDGFSEEDKFSRDI